MKNPRPEDHEILFSSRTNLMGSSKAADKMIGRRILQFSLAMTAMVTVAAIVYYLNGGSETVERSQQEVVGRVAILGVGPNARGDRVYAWVKNVGVAPINAINESEIFVITPGARFDAMKYGAAGGDNTWVEDPVGSSWNQGDTLKIVITLPVGDPLALGDHVLRVFPPNGITVEKTFIR